MRSPYPMRVQKYLSRCAKGSRRTCERFVEEGRVTINGETVTEPGTQVNEGDLVTLDGDEVEPVEAKYYLLNKPKGYISVNKDPGGRRWVVELIPEAERSGCFPAGRLDLDTTGLMIITNDGDLSFRISHPRFEIRKEYRALIKGKWTLNELRDAVKDGVVLDNGGRVDGIEIIEAEPVGIRTSVLLSIHEGRKHVVKRIFLSLGSRVYDLERTAIGNIEIGDLAMGSYRELNLEEILEGIGPIDGS